jgi:hypothetical protein
MKLKQTFAISESGVFPSLNDRQVSGHEVVAHAAGKRECLIEATLDEVIEKQTSHPAGFGAVL